MKVEKRKIYLESSTDRSANSETWGTMTASTFYLNVFITQDVDDMGLFTDMSFIPKNISSSTPNYQILSDKLRDIGVIFPFMNGYVPNQITNLTESEKKTLRIPQKVESDYYNFGNLPITGRTDSKIDDVKSYSSINPYRINFNVNKAAYINYQNTTIVGVDRIKTLGDPNIYVFDTVEDVNLGTPTQIYGIQYHDYTGSTTPYTTFRILGEGWNQTNTSISALGKEEYLFGIISRPEVESDVFIDRGAISVMDMHLKLSEIKNLGQLTRYGNGFYKINKQ